MEEIGNTHLEAYSFTSRGRSEHYFHFSALRITLQTDLSFSFFISYCLLVIKVSTRISQDF